MVSKHGNVIMNANTKAEQERLKSLGYNELEVEEDVRICAGSYPCTCDDGKTEQSSENEKDKPAANKRAEKKTATKNTAEK
nr:MAG TPA: Complement C5-like protein [Caudoviricetes sp.]